MKRPVQEDNRASSETSEDSDDGDQIEKGHVETVPPTKRSKLSKAELYKPPTNVELTTLKETSALYESSLFRMQISELIAEVTPKSKKNSSLEKVLHSLYGTLDKLPSGKQYDLTDQSWLPDGIEVPIIQEPCNGKGMFFFEKPAAVKVIGSYLLETCTKPNMHVDIVLQIPKVCLQRKDYLNFVYHRKRALYLACIAHQLKNVDYLENIKYSYMNGDYFKPILILKPSGKIGKSYVIRVHTCLPESFCKLSICHPDRNNVRVDWFTGRQGEPNTPTPHYNNSIAIDLFMEQHLRHLFSEMEDFTGMREGIVLLKVWLHQRQLNKGVGGFTGFIMSMLVSYLLSLKRLNKLMSSYQVLRNTLYFLANSDWTRRGISLCKHEDDEPITADYHKHYDVIFIDTSGYVNLCADVSRLAYLQVKHEAELSLKYMESISAVDSFQALFMTKVPFTRKFDHIFHVSKLSHLQSCCKQFDVEDSVSDHGGDFVTAVLPSIVEILEKGTGKRIKLFGMHQPPHKEWSVNEKPPHWKDLTHLTFGLLLDPEYSMRVLDMGPPADSQEAADFRQFWGNKAELRRFQDASICEAVVWPCMTMADKRLVCNQIIVHLLKLHAGIPPGCITYLGGHLDSLLRQPQDEKHKPAKKSRKELSGTGDEENLAVIHAFDSLNKKLRGLKDLPLSIASIQGTSPVFRYAQVFPPNVLHKPASRGLRLQGYIQCPLPHTPSQWVPVLKVICTMERSGKWPDDLLAIQRIKAAFHIRLSQMLHKEYKVVTAATDKFVDAFVDGFVFRIHVAYPREVVLLKQETTPQGLLQLRDTTQSLELEKETISLPKLTSALHSIHQSNPTFSGTVRLAKRWVSSHLLYSYLKEEAIELLVAHLFLNSAPFTVPGSPVVGFLRFLHLLANHDWINNPLIVNISDNYKAGDHDDILEKFKCDRSQHPAMFISTPLYKLSSPWTTPDPSTQVLQRLILLARESLQLLEQQMSDCYEQQQDYKQIFRPPVGVYDVIIHLKSKYLSKCDHAIDYVRGNVIEKSQKGEDNRKILPVVNFDPAEKYLQELQ
ncbi:nucleolar protein 6, partial [Saccoglossus kowalevskii]|uniref:Nucleolar protein 6 n=1 Tax=Saccoglossus kowalevskii TaxID=10224 RepID=A0ABM0GKA2_SACKO